MTKFSIVIPVYNVKTFLPECLDSIIAQIEVLNNLSGSTAEIIIVDDGSTDGSSEIIDYYATTFSNCIRAIHTENQGTLKARLTGFTAAEGEYIINIDSDDFVVKKMLVTIYQALVESNDPDVLFYNGHTMSYLGHCMMPRHPFKNDTNKLTSVDKEEVWKEFFCSYKLDSVRIISACFKTFKRSKVSSMSDDSLSNWGVIRQGDDTIITAEVLKNADTVYYLDEDVYIYRAGSGITSKADMGFWRNYSVVIDYVKKMLPSICCKDKDDLFSLFFYSWGGVAIAQMKSSSISFIKKHTYLSGIRRSNIYKENIMKYPLPIRLKKNYFLYNFLLIHHLYIFLIALLGGVNIYIKCLKKISFRGVTNI